MKRLITFLLLIPAWAMAQDATPAQSKSFADLYPPLPGVEYFCTNSEGERVEVGGVVCITASCTTWMARCEMTSSNRMAIWRKTQDGCPGASLLQRLQAVEPVL